MWLWVASGAVVWVGLVFLVASFFAFGSRNDRSALPDQSAPEPTCQPSLERNNGSTVH